MTLKPQDIVVLLKLCGYSQGTRPPYSVIAKELIISPSEIHAAVKRLKNSHLLHGTEMGEKPNLSAIKEFLIHGLKYAFPVERGAMSRGIPTSYAAAPLKDMLSPGNEPIPVWASSHGTARGITIKPLYKTAPAAAELDPFLYERLALLDAVRDGRVRERNLAEEALIARLNRTNDQS